MLSFKLQVHSVAVTSNPQVWVESTGKLLSTTTTNYCIQSRLINIED